MELIQLHDGHDDFWGFAESRIGGRQENQDSFGFRKTKVGFVVTVCDGMGGGPGGKKASSIAVDEILSSIEKSNGEEEIANILLQAIRKANLSIWEYAKFHPKFKGMGSTATVLLLNEDIAHVAHVGDSRVYQLRGRRKIFRTFDHSMVFDLVKQKIISEEQARLSAQSNIITRALGIRQNVDIDLARLPYEKGDRFLLCTDGIHGTMPESELLRMLSKKVSLGTIVDDVATFVDQNGHNLGGGHDNLTLAMVQTKSNSKIKPKMSRKVKLFVVLLSLFFVFSIGLNCYQLIRISNLQGKIDMLSHQQEKEIKANTKISSKEKLPSPLNTVDNNKLK